MKNFAKLFERLDETTKTNDRIQALVEFFEQSSEADSLWAIALLGGKGPRRVVQSNLIKEWIAEVSEIPIWLFEESYQVVGDMSETIALLLPENNHESNKGLSEWMGDILTLADKDEKTKKVFVTNAWRTLNRMERFIFNKLIGGSFRIGISQMKLDCTYRD